MKIGDTVIFGKYTWRILELEPDRMLLLTEYIIEQGSYHHIYEPITWEKCSLRQYLNTDFYEAFSDDEKARILLVENENKDNHWYHTSGGNTTKDHVFILSLEEVTCRYFGDSQDKLLNPGKNQRYWFQRKDVNNKKRVAYLADRPEKIWWWWIRTPGRVGVKSVYIHGDGNIGIQGNNIYKGNLSDGYCTGGIRPAMWVKREG